MRRRGLLAAAGLLGLAAGCGGGPPAGAATWSMWSSSPAEAKVWHDFSGYVHRTLGVRSVPTLTPSTGYPTKLDLQLVSGTASLVTAINGWLLPTYAARGAFRPLDDLVAGDPSFDLDDFYPDIRRMSTFDGHTYGIGFDVAPTVLYYNRTLFSKRGIPVPSPTVPMTWARFRALAKEFASVKGQYGFTCAPAIDDLVSWLYCAGGDVMDAGQTRCALGDEPAMTALRFVMDLFTSDRVTPPIDNLVTTDALSNFLEGNVAFMQNGPWQVVNARKAGFDWDIVPFPAGPAGSRPRLSGSVFAMPAGTRDTALAWRLLKALTSTGALTIYARAGRNNPARRSAGTAFTPPPANLGLVQRILAGRAGTAGGHPYTTTTTWNEVRQVLAQELPKAFLGQAGVGSVVAGLAPRIDSLMAQHQANLRQLGAAR